MSEPLVDGHGREIGDLRISVTDRCSFRCTYCMPAEGLAWLDRADLLTFEETTRLVSIFASMGVRDVRLTGGEPLMRRDFPRLVSMLHSLGSLDDISVTTNGLLLRRQLDDLVAAGLRRLNVSLDSLVRERFEQVTRRDALDEVLAGLAAAAEHEQLRPIKVNVVALRDFTEGEVVDFAELARTTPYVVRFIEYMPLDADHAWKPEAVLTGDELRALIERRYPLERVGRDAAGTAERWRFADGTPGELGFINPVSHPFCSDCNRVRLTAEGKLRTCLFSLYETDLRTPLREGATDAEIETLIRDAVWRKELKHRIGEQGFRQPPRTMSQIGG